MRGRRTVRRVSGEFRAGAGQCCVCGECGPTSRTGCRPGGQQVVVAVQAPELSGVISGAELAADVPAVGLKLKEGQLQARPAPSGEITVPAGKTVSR